MTKHLVNFISSISLSQHETMYNMKSLIEPDVLCKICHVTILGKYSDPICDEYPDFICKKCQPDGLNLCAECGDLFIDSDMNWESYDKGNSYCNQCGESK